MRRPDLERRARIVQLRASGCRPIDIAKRLGISYGLVRQFLYLERKRIRESAEQL